MVLQAGTVFAGFAIERLLGTGGMGAVYLAQHPRLERLVALKVLHDAYASDPKARIAFDRETALAARLQHPNIVPVHDRSAPDDPALWLSMQYIDGGDTNALLAIEPQGLSAERVVRLLTDAAHALDFAHDHGVLHRDVKPANLLVQHHPHDRERVLLTDFGIARTLDDTATLSSVYASLPYAAPERFTDHPTDRRADIYSLGCTFYQLLTGQPPFPRPHHAAVMAAHLTDPPPAPSRLRPHLSTALDMVIATAMAKHPADRYSTCTEMVDAAAEVLSATLVTDRYRRRAETAASPTVASDNSHPAATTVVRAGAGISPAAQAPSNPPSRLSRRRLLAGGIVAVPLIAVGGGIVGLRAHKSSESPVTATPQPPIPDGSLTAHAGEVFSVAFSPDGTLLATGHFDRTVRLWNMRTRQPDGPPLTGHTDLVRSVAFSPNGTLLATGSFDGTVRLWNMRTRQLDGPPLTGHTGFVNSVTFSPDGTCLASGGSGAGETVRLWNMATRQLDGQLSPAVDDNTGVRSVTFSPDGTRLVAAGNGNAVWVWNAHTRQPDGAPFIGHAGVAASAAFNPDSTLLATGSPERTVRLWNVRTRQPDGQPFHVDGGLIPVAFSPDGTLLAAGTTNTVTIWNMRTRQPVGQPLIGNTAPVLSIAFSPDGTALAAGSQDTTVQLWKFDKAQR
ncbi:WD40 repeat domain-containing serine/threonine protein kinase [Nocardia sp. NPDC051570]|uniref:WD40 repeat domain-containing serine/threonine protein kinase n=1 Tax=Nocardia sp. NPDC051570 TaxID=3364324 RepID=UPI0037A4375A